MQVQFQYKDRLVSFCLHVDKAKGGDHPHDGLSRNIYQLKTFYDVEGLERTLPLLRPDSIVVDCGAMIGNHTVFWSPYVAKIHAIEPAIENRQLLERNVSINGLRNVVVHPQVISDIKQRWTAKSPSKHKGPTYFIPDKSGEYESDTLDNLVSDRVDLLKVDVEGAENRVLAGASRVLSDHPVILLEMHYCPEEPAYLECMDILASFGYQRDRDLFVDDKWSAKKSHKHG